MICIDYIKVVYFKKKRVSLAKRKSRSMFVDYNVDRFKLIFHCKEGNLGLGIIEVRPYKLVMCTIHEISCDAYWIQLSSPKKYIKRSLIYATTSEN